MKQLFAIPALITSAIAFSAFPPKTWPQHLTEFSHSTIAQIHKAEIELLKMDWGQPGFCTEWDSELYSRHALLRNAWKTHPPAIF